MPERNGTGPRTFSAVEARPLVADLFTPNPLIYWADFLGAAVGGHPCFLLVRQLPWLVPAPWGGPSTIAGKPSCPWPAPSPGWNQRTHAMNRDAGVPSGQPMGLLVEAPPVPSVPELPQPRVRGTRASRASMTRCMLPA